MDSMKIRPIIRTDCLAIVKLIKELAETKKVEDYVAVKSQDLESDGFNHEPTFFNGVIAEMDGTDKKPEVIGVALYHLKYSTWEGQVMHLNTFVVSEKHRRQAVGTKIIKYLAKIALNKKYPRISLEASGLNEAGMAFFEKHGALNLSKKEAWLNYHFSSKEVKKIVEFEAPKNAENIRIRPTEPKDCEQILGMIQELADFEKMPDGPKLSVKDLQRDGFYKLHPCFYSFVAELTDSESEETEIIGFNAFFLTYDPFKGKMIHLEDLYVSPKHRTKGVGQLLFHALSEYVEGGDYNGFTLEVLDWNTKAIQFYDKFGGTNLTTSSKALQSFRFQADSIKALVISK